MAKDDIMLDVEIKAADLKTKIEAREKDKADKAAAEAKLLIVASVRKSPLRMVWYITLSNKKMLTTRNKVHFDAALRMMTAKAPIPVSYKEAKETDGRYWLSEIKTA